MSAHPWWLWLRELSFVAFLQWWSVVQHGAGLRRERRRNGVLWEKWWATNQFCFCGKQEKDTDPPVSELLDLCLGCRCIELSMAQIAEIFVSTTMAVSFPSTKKWRPTFMMFGHPNPATLFTVAQCDLQQPALLKKVKCKFCVWVSAND